MRKRRAILPPVYLTLVLALMYLPILMVVLYSFNDSRTSATWAGFTTEWYAKLFRNQGIALALLNSLQLAGWSVAASAVIGTAGAVGMTRARFRGKGAMETVSTLPIMVPEIILGIAYMALFTAIGLPLGMPTLVIAHTTFCVPYVYIIVKGRLVGADPALEEAARDLGASPARVFFTVTLPLILPAVLSGMLLSLAMSLDDLVISFFVSGPASTTLPLKIYSGLKTGVTPEINALCTLMLGTVFLLVALSQLASAKRNHPARSAREDTAPASN
ncbi:MAG: ABC transporter permease subunit [Clostridia bacterium]|nr:ABC transporter permease subunit [Clostridia bacterium]